MKTTWNKQDITFIAQQLLLMAQAMIDGAEETGRLDREKLQELLRLAEKFSPNAVYVPLKLRELDHLAYVISTLQHQLEEVVIPEIEKGDSPDKEQKLEQGKSVLAQAASVYGIIEGYIKKANEFRT